MKNPDQARLLTLWKTIYYQIDYEQFDPLIKELLALTLVNAWKWNQKQGFNFDHFSTNIKTKAIVNQLYQPSQIYQAIALAIAIEKDYFYTKYLNNAWKARDRMVSHFAKMQRYSNRILKTNPWSNQASEHAYKCFQKWWDQHRRWQILI